MSTTEQTLDLQFEHDDLIEEIYVAFAGVTRQGGVSWSEIEVLDACGTMEQRLAARATDKDATWQSLLDDPCWNPDYITPWAFLDAIGYRYYLAPAMIVGLHRGESQIDFHLTLPKDDLRDYYLEQWSLLTPEQMRCVKRFVVYMDAVEVGCGDEWVKALYSYWDKVE